MTLENLKLRLEIEKKRNNSEQVTMLEERIARRMTYPKYADVKKEVKEEKKEETKSKEKK